ncbi:type II toxin-antitoxin system antitoxin HipB [Pantoea allii]|uniref:HTH-type transcriptional regulator/antitoxin HipB n=1 Tax=Pantoea allii TaxID=574096 RepID=A0A2V2BNN5_9GAMM|nr:MULTISPECIES: type II toxin-antitoxin system antitoxin HipB [Pantoea]MBW1252961.1 type II toxin-antitoxin system antitoxin HipB [Pantoea allii]MBW1262261.1 type II toxin-antitoxin system antitoxin HipB [Pantoea allii]MBW1283390.1 type II toxin-antitoxin system antitoxin HipB [Pantoea allii]MCH9298450.1 type II toxin-antitoxin system antitoxin HipB [Pantoea allii]MDJ0035609.1 type II toxin-antitoxin system antitoxin HipB [Pantoea allii]
MIYSPRQLANQVKLLRQQDGLTQAELAKTVGLKQATLSHFENNPETTSLATLFKILQALNLAVVLQGNPPASASSEDAW